MNKYRNIALIMIISLFLVNVNGQIIELNEDSEPVQTNSYYDNNWGLDGNWGFSLGTSFLDLNSSNTLTEYKTPINYQLGVLYYIGSGYNNFQYRTGLLWTQRDWEFMTLSGTGEVNMSELDIPITVEYISHNNKFSAYTGFNLGINMSGSCSSNNSPCVVKSPKKALILFTVGSSYYFSEYIGVDFYYETSLNEFVHNTDISNFGFNLIFRSN